VVDEAVAARVGREVFLLSLSGDQRVLGWALPRFVRALNDVYLAAGEVVFREGEPAESHYFVVSGEVALSRPGAPPRHMGERSVIGTLDMLLERPRHRTATAAVPTHLLRMAADDWWALIEDRLDLAQRIVGNIASSIRAMRARPEPLGGFDPPPPASAGDPPRGLNLVERILLLRRAPLLAHASIQSLTTLAELSTELHAPAEGGLLSPAATKGRIVVVAWGEVTAVGRGAAANETVGRGAAANETVGRGAAANETVAKAPAVSGRFGPGALVLGAAALDPNGDHELSARGGTVALTLPIEDYFDTMEEHFSVARSTLMAVAQERDDLLER
jgi:CRP-like cAMP-binding protein